MKTLKEEPPKLPKEPCWDESFEEFIQFCLVKDPSRRYSSKFNKKFILGNRKSAEELFNKCKNFFNKAKGKGYVKDKLLKNLPPLEERVSYLFILIS